MGSQMPSMQPSEMTSTSINDAEVSLAVQVAIHWADAMPSKSCIYFFFKLQGGVALGDFL
jgi:hypothetical protein